MVPGTTDKTHAHEREMPNVALSLYEATLQHIGLIQEKRDALERAQREAEQQVLHRIALDYRAGVLQDEDLFDVMDAFKAASTDRGFATRWSAVVPVHWSGLLNLRRAYAARHKPNGPNGTWVGTFPLPFTVPQPHMGLPVVYVLFDPLNVPCYVGSTERLRTRLRAHAREGKVFKSWQAYPCEDRELAYQTEDRLLREHKPYLNKKAGR